MLCGFRMGMKGTGARHVVLLRHAKAEDEAASDFERRLTAKGQTQAARIGLALRNASLAPDAIVASPAPRALETARLAAQAAGAKAQVEEDAGLYEADAKAILSCIERHGLRPTLWVVGHNPGLQDAGILLGDLWGNWHLDKACAVAFELEAWPPAAGGARLVKLLAP